MNQEQEALASAADLARLSAQMPELERLVAQAEQVIENRVLTALMSGPLDPQFAVQMWMEKAVWMRIKRGMQARVRVGQTVAEEIRPLLDQINR